MNNKKKPSSGGDHSTAEEIQAAALAAAEAFLAAQEEKMGAWPQKWQMRDAEGSVLGNTVTLKVGLRIALRRCPPAQVSLCATLRLHQCLSTGSS